MLSKSPSDTHATARVSIVEKCVQIKQILPTVCSAALKIFIVCLDMKKKLTSELSMTDDQNGP